MTNWLLCVVFLLGSLSIGLLRAWWIESREHESDRIAREHLADQYIDLRQKYDSRREGMVKMAEELKHLKAENANLLQERQYLYQAISAQEDQ